MPTAVIEKADDYGSIDQVPNRFPEVLHTPSGIALVEIQGIINVNDKPLLGSELDLAKFEGYQSDDDDITPGVIRKHLGQFDFSKFDKGEVTLEVGDNQILRGKVAKLRTPLAVLEMSSSTASSSQDQNANTTIPIVEIIRHKITFSLRPEPLIKR
ncbi:hypothetical protein TRVA0_072S00122 [Trichomonascus vanleenenianus]|uniref:Ctf8p n=1 Tax=Trichomonascus vanleenenianus TaxID=2268995 RepID=UPI003ECB46C7